MKKTYAILRTKSIGSAYSILNRLLDQGFQLFEISPVAEGAHLIVFSEESDVVAQKKYQELHDEISYQVFNAKCLPLSNSLIEAYLSLGDLEIQNNLVIIENEFLGEIFEASQKLVDAGMVLLDLRFAKGYKQKAHAFFTGEISGGARDILTSLKQLGFHCTEEANLHHELRNLFNTK